ncbi:Lipopolysaccharide assembly protein A [Serratia symbiotica]|nr:Lipopolysaccharide assembly protein A [Serratia symbiotica]
MKYLLIFLFGLVIFVISLTFSMHNDQVITINYLIAKGDYQVSALLAMIFCIGFIFGCVIFAIFYLRTRLILSRAKRKIKKLMLQLEQTEKLFVQPITKKE